MAVEIIEEAEEKKEELEAYTYTYSRRIPRHEVN